MNCEELLALVDEGIQAVHSRDEEALNRVFKAHDDLSEEETKAFDVANLITAGRTDLDVKINLPDILEDDNLSEYWKECIKKRALEVIGQKDETSEELQREAFMRKYNGDEKKVDWAMNLI